MKAQHELKIVGVHYAVNPNYQEMEPSPEMEERTIEVLKNLNEKLPRVVLMPEPTNPVDQLAVMARVRGKRIGYVLRFHLGAVHRILKQTGKRSHLPGLSHGLPRKPSRAGCVLHRTG